MSNSPNLIFKIANERFCVYCGKTIHPSKNGVYRCSCPDAQLAYDLVDSAFQLEMEAAKKRNLIPKPRFVLKTVCAPIENVSVIDDDPPDPCV